MTQKNNHIVNDFTGKRKDVINIQSVVNKLHFEKAVKRPADAIVSGDTVSNNARQFVFSIISPEEQMQERNSAYHFFSID